MAQHPPHAVNEPTPIPDISTPPPSMVPFLPNNPQHLSQQDVERMIDSRVHIAVHSALNRMKEVDLKKQRNTTIMVGVGGLVVGGVITAGVGAIYRARKARLAVVPA